MMDIFVKALIYGGLNVLAFAVGIWAGMLNERYEWQHGKREK